MGAGDEVRQPFADAFLGERHGQVDGHFRGHRAAPARRADDELVRAAAAAFGGGS